MDKFLLYNHEIMTDSSVLSQSDLSKDVRDSTICQERLLSLRSELIYC